jgi:hypothetical protein
MVYFRFQEHFEDTKEVVRSRTLETKMAKKKWKNTIQIIIFWYLIHVTKRVRNNQL